MIPIRDNIPSQNKPIVCYLLIGINVALFIWEIKLGFSGFLRDVIYSWGVIPARISSVAMDALASNNPAVWLAMIMVSLSVVPAMFLHGSYSQIIGNLIYLFVFGRTVEDKLGHGKFLLFYLGCGVLTSVVQILAEPTLSVPLIGANGAISSILGAYLFSFPKAKIDTLLPLVIIFIPIELPAMFYLFWWFIQQGAYGFGKVAIAGGVNSLSIGYLAHGVGILIGASVMYAIDFLQKSGERRKG